MIVDPTAFPVRDTADSGWDAGPLDCARTAFDWLIRGPEPVSVDGRMFPGLPARRVPLNEVRDRLLRRRCPQATRDAVWAHLVLRSRTEGATWTVGCVGVGLPALTRTAATLSARFAADPSDIHAAVLTGFVAELAHIDLRKPRIMARLRWAAYRAGHTALREALDAPRPAGTRPQAVEPAAPSGHPDFVLARAVADAVLDPAEAELIGATRLEGVPLATAAETRGVSYPRLHQVRRRAEQRLLAYLREDTIAEYADTATQAADLITLTRAAAPTPTPTPTITRPCSPSVTARGADEPEKVGVPVSKTGPKSGVQRCDGPLPAPASIPADDPSPATPEGTTMHPTVHHHPTALAPAALDPPADELIADERVVAEPVLADPVVTESDAAVRREGPAGRGPGPRRPRRSRRRGQGRRRRRTRARTRAGVPRGGVAVAVLVAAVLVFGPVGAAHADTARVLALAGSVDQVLTNLRNWIMGILAGLATVFVSIGGVRYLMAGGDPSEVEKAKTAFRSAGIGYALAALAPLVVSVLQGIVGS